MSSSTRPPRPSTGSLDAPPARVVVAAGGVLWACAGEGVRVALVHRPRYDDWSFPKGKAHRGELALAAAYREVVEETGIRPVVGPRLGVCCYWTPRGPKQVAYWAMRVGEVDEPVSEGGEVDRLEWLAVAEAHDRLTYEEDQALLGALAAVAVPVSSAVLLVRHGSAGDPATWHGDDRHRPLDPKGRQQARALRSVLTAFAPTRVLSVWCTRCVETVAPVAADLGLDVMPVHALSEAEYAKHPGQGLRTTIELALEGGTTVICSQGAVIPDLVAKLEGQRGPLRTELESKKGSLWAAWFAGDRLVAADYYASLLGWEHAGP